MRRRRAPRAATADDVDLARRLAAAHDASHFLLVPSAVTTARSVAQVSALLAACTAARRPLTFRSGGTSLSGQAQTDSLLVDTRRGFRGIEVLDDGRRISVEPGAVLRSVNARLAPLGYRLGPDPASEAACTVGGVVANNSSGMTCGTEFNAYRTVESMQVVLASGSVLDLGAVRADDDLRAREPAVHAGLVRLRDRVRADPRSVREITRQFAIKNTMGYGLNAFLDHDEPAEILTRLLVGSEGTLGFVSRATFRTVPLRPHAATAFLVFDSLDRALAALPPLLDTGLAAIEVLDARALRVAQQDPAWTRALPSVAVDAHAGLLVEFGEGSVRALDERVEVGRAVIGELVMAAPADFTAAAAARADLWHARKGLYAAVAGARPAGTTALLEDVAVPIPALGETCAGLAGLFDRHGYEESVIFGHAKDGNLHFLLNERFDRPEALARYAAFTDDLVDLVLGAGGTLKAEHGTGRVMAPFVRRQYGDELYDVMREVKTLLDPAGVLNPGVIVSDDTTIHLRHLKTTPTVDVETVERLEAVTAYAVVDTCAVDGMCATACPLQIDTGALTKRLRAERVDAAADATWATAARHWDMTTAVASRALSMAHGHPRSAAVAGQVLDRVIPAGVAPRWDSGLPAGGERRRERRADDPIAVYVPACVGVMFGPEDGLPGVRAAFTALCAHAGVVVDVPPGVESACCGTPFSSKGMRRAHAELADRMGRWLWQVTDAGRLSVVTDASSCTEGFAALAEGAPAGPVTVVDALTFVRNTVVPALLARGELPLVGRLPSIAVHPTCSTARRGSTDDLLALAALVAERVEVPYEWGCCGFAGDRGLLHPELTASASAAQSDEVRRLGAPAHASANRTCELALTRATGQPYGHVLEHLAMALGLIPGSEPTARVGAARLPEIQHTPHPKEN